MTKKIMVGSVAIGGGAPISVQSMCNTDTRDIDTTVLQILDLENAGCDIVRVAVFDTDAAEAIRKIRSSIHIPIVADVHFDYRLAIIAAENGADKLRINPGNIGSEDRVKMVADCCKAHRVPIRIGVNGGSLEKDLFTTYLEDPVRALVESGIRHIRILEHCGFQDIALSIKHTDVATTVAAYHRAHDIVDYPLHVGITETGPIDSGIIKSAAGIGALLLDGIGDTIRVSLTGNPVREVETGISILRALGIRKDDVEIISCPTCGRTRCNVEEAVSYVNSHVRHNAGYLKIAVMGCAVNGPGEARNADIGVAFGDGKGVLFRKGEIIESGSYERMLKRIVELSDQLLIGSVNR